MRGKVENFKVLSVWRGNLSYYGNPSWFLQVETKEGEIITGKTGSNCAIGYEITYSMEGKTLKMEYHFTQKGNLIFTRLYK